MRSVIIFSYIYNMTEDEVLSLKQSDLLRCKKDYLDCFKKDEIYYVYRIEDLGEMIYTLQYNGHIVTWFLKEIELILWFEKF